MYHFYDITKIIFTQERICSEMLKSSFFFNTMNFLFFRDMAWGPPDLSKKKPPDPRIWRHIFNLSHVNFFNDPNSSAGSQIS